MARFDDDEIRDGGQAEELEEGAAPDPVGVYERPERDGPSAATAIIAVVVLLLLLGVAYLLLQATIF